MLVIVMMIGARRSELKMPCVEDSPERQAGCH